MFYREFNPLGERLPSFLIFMFVGYRPKLFNREAWPRSSTTLNFFCMTLAGTLSIVEGACAGTLLGLISLAGLRPALSYRCGATFFELVSLFTARTFSGEVLSS